jgi:hypothetical protein
LQREIQIVAQKDGPDETGTSRANRRLRAGWTLAASMMDIDARRTNAAPKPLHADRENPPDGPPWDHVFAPFNSSETAVGVAGVGSKFAGNVSVARVSAKWVKFAIRRNRHGDFGVESEFVRPANARSTGSLPLSMDEITNVVASAFLWQGMPGRLLKMAEVRIGWGERSEPQRKR